MSDPNTYTTVFPSAARTATATSGNIRGGRALGAIFTLYVSAASGTTPTLDVKVQAQDPASRQWYDIPGAAFAQQVAATTAPLDLVLYPGVVATANRSVLQPARRTMRVVATIGGTSPSFTFSVGCQLLD